MTGATGWIEGLLREAEDQDTLRRRLGEVPHTPPAAVAQGGIPAVPGNNEELREIRTFSAAIITRGTTPCAWELWEGWERTARRVQAESGPVPGPGSSACGRVLVRNASAPHVTSPNPRSVRRLASFRVGRFLEAVRTATICSNERGSHEPRLGTTASTMRTNEMSWLPPLVLWSPCSGPTLQGRARNITPQVDAALRAAGLYSLTVPPKFGGREAGIRPSLRRCLPNLPRLRLELFGAVDTGTRSRYTSVWSHRTTRSSLSLPRRSSL